MSKNTNRDYIIIIDVKSSDILEADTLQFYINDNESHNIFVQLVIKDTREPINKYVSIDDPSKYVVKMNIVKPTNEHETITGELVSVEDSLYQFVLPNSCVNNTGTYKCEVETYYNNRVTNSNKIRYKIKKSVLNDLDSVVKAPGYPIVIQLLDKLSDIEKYEEDRRANELARQLAEEQRKTNYDELVADMTDSIEAIDNKVVDVENRITAKEQEVDTLIADTKADIDNYKVAKDQEIDDYKTAKDTEINQAIANQDNKISEAITKQDKNISDAIADQDNKIDTAIEEQNNRLDSIEVVNASQDTRLDAIEIKNRQQDDRLLDAEKVNKRQDMDLKMLFAESKNNMIDVTEEGNSIYLQNSTVGYTLIDEVQGNTLVNCNKEADKELILNGNINTQGYSNITLTEGVDGGLVDVTLEGNTMVNVCDQKDPVAITKSYTVETGNHIALQGEYDGKCRPVVYGNTLVNLMTTYKDEELLEYLFPIQNPNVANVSMLKPNTEYTLIYKARYQKEGDAGVLIICMSENRDEDIYVPYDITTTYQQFAFKFTTLSSVNYFTLRSNSSYFYVKDVMLLEGDYTNKPIPGYFEGLQSSFEDKVVTQEMVDSGEELAENLGKYKVEYKVTGKNKFNAISSLKDYATSSDGIISFVGTGDTRLWGYTNSQYKLRIKKGTYTITINTISTTGLLESNQLQIYGSDNEIISILNKDCFSTENSSMSKQFIVTEDCEIGIMLKFTNGTCKIQLEEGSVATPYEPYKEYKKTFYLNSPLLEGDTIEQSGNNVVHVHRYNKIVLDGSDTVDHGSALVTNHSDDSTLVHQMWIKYSKYYPSRKDLGFCDKVKYVPYDRGFRIAKNLGTEAINTGGGYTCIYLRLTKAKLPSEDVAGFKSYMQSNPITLIYELATPQYEVISRNDTILCDSYVNGHLDVDSVVPIKKVTFDHWRRKLKYFYIDTNYTLQFEADNIGTCRIAFGANLIHNGTINKGINKITGKFTDSNPVLTFNGIGFNASNIVVTEATDQEFGYFEGMKSCFEDNLVTEGENAGKYKVTYKVTGKNKFNRNTLVHNTEKGITVTFNGGSEIKVEGTYNSLDLWNSYELDLKLKAGTYTFKCYYPEGCYAPYIRLQDNTPIYSGNTFTLKEDSKLVSLHLRGDNGVTYNHIIQVQLEEGTEATSYEPYKEYTKTLYLNAPLLEGDTIEEKDGNIYHMHRYKKVVLDGSKNKDINYSNGISTNNCNDTTLVYTIYTSGDINIPSGRDSMLCDKLQHQRYDASFRNEKNFGTEAINTGGGYCRIFLRLLKSKLSSEDATGFKQYLQQNPLTIVYQLATPQYELIQQGTIAMPTYSDITHISNNSTIPCNMTIKNTGYNCLLKPSTTYTVSSNLGLNTITTPSTLTEDCLRFYDTDTSTVTTMKDVTILEGDYTTGKPLPSHFSGIESAFEQEYDETVGKYKVKIIVQNEDASKENYIEFYIDEPLRGVGEVKDKVYVKDDKVVVERICGQRAYQEGDFGTHLTDKVSTVYQLAEPVYEEVEYNDVKLFIEIFKNSTLFYDSNIPVTSKVWYSYSIPLVDTVAQTTDISDQQDQLIIDLATQCAIMEIMLM